MTTSFSYTMPTLADKLRNKGHSFYPSSSLRGLDLLTGASEADDVHHSFSKGAINTSNQRVLEAFKSTQRFLYPKFQYVKNGTTASQPFASSSNQAGKMGFSGGSFNTATQGQRMSDDEWNKYRQTVLDRRINGLQAIREGIVPPSMPITPFQALSSGKSQIDLLLTSIEERVYEDLFSPEIYRELTNLTSLFIASIWEINDATALSGYVERLEGLSLVIDEETTENIDELDQKEIKYSRAIEGLSRRLSSYILNNIKGVGANEVIRKRLAMDLSMLKINRKQQEDILRMGNPLAPPPFGGLPPQPPFGGTPSASSQVSGDSSSGGPSGPFLEEYGNDGQASAPAPEQETDGSQQFGPLGLNTFKQWIREAPKTQIDTALAHRRILEQLSNQELQDLARAAWGYTGNATGQSLRTYIYNKYKGMGHRGGNLALDIFSLGGLPIARAILGKGHRGGMIPPHMRPNILHGNLSAPNRVLFNSR